jgi:hypothetical protein
VKKKLAGWTTEGDAVEMHQTPLLCDSPLLLVIPQVAVTLRRLASLFSLCDLVLVQLLTEPHHGRDLVDDACLLEPLPGLRLSTVSSRSGGSEHLSLSFDVSRVNMF